MISRKQIILFLLLASASSAHAGWFNLTLGIIRHAWAIPFIAQSYQLYRQDKQETAEDQKNFEPHLQTECPKAHAYIHTELSHVGIDPAAVTIIDSHAPEVANNRRILLFPVRRFEQLLNADSAQQLVAYRLSKTKSFLAHEIYHITVPKSLIPKPLIPLITAVGVGIASHASQYLPHPQPNKSVLKVLCTCAGAAAKFTAARYITILAMPDYESTLQEYRREEYQADGACITRFKNDPQNLYWFAHHYANRHIKRTYKAASFNLKCYWSEDASHPSDLSRATRFFTAAGYPTAEQKFDTYCQRQEEFIRTPLGKDLYSLMRWDHWNYIKVRKGRSDENTPAWLAQCAQKIQEIPTKQKPEACTFVASFIAQLSAYAQSHDNFAREYAAALKNYQATCHDVPRTDYVS